MKKLTLTFDNGPEPEVTPLVLDILARRGLLTTFFVVGQKLLDPERMELATRARKEGHRIGNHTFTHSTPLGQMEDAAAAVTELERTDELVARTGETEKLFRPFGAESLCRSAPYARLSGRMTVIVQNRSEIL